MEDILITPPPPGVKFIAGTLPKSLLSKSLGICRLFGTCGAEAINHHAHVKSSKDWILLATLGGGGNMKTAMNTYKVEPGTLFLVPPSIAFQEFSTGQAAWSWICLRIQLIKGNHIFSPTLTQPWSGRPGLSVVQNMSDIVTYTHMRSPGFEHETIARLIELLGMLILNIQNNSVLNPSAFAEKACSLMRHDPGHPWTIEELSRNCNMSVSSFAHRFTKELGLTPKQQLKEERMREARHLLADRYSIKDIAYRLGYSSRYHFTHVFTEMEGISPGHFQQLATKR